jgi:tyrosinase
VAVSPPSGVAPGQLVVGGFGDHTRWVLRLTGIRSQRPAPTSFEVYIGLSKTDSATPTDSRHYVGLLSLFGVYEATVATGSTGGSGRMRMFDITDVITSLGTQFDVGTATIGFIAVHSNRDVAAANITVEQITIEVV